MKQALMLTVQFRRLATPPSKKALMSLHQDAGWTVDPKEIDKLRKPAPDFIWMAAVRQGSDTPVALGRLQVAGSGVAFLSEFVVKKELAGKGLGSALLKYIESFCAGSKIERLALRPMPSTEAFYQAKGFSADPVFPDVLMKILSAPGQAFK